MVSTHTPLQMLLTTMAPVAPEQVMNQLFGGGRNLASPGNSQFGARLTTLQLWTAIKAIRYAYPALVFLYFITALTLTVCTLQTQRLRIKDEHVRRDVILGLIFGVTVTYVRPQCLGRWQQSSTGRHSWQSVNFVDPE